MPWTRPELFRISLDLPPSHPHLTLIPLSRFITLPFSEHTTIPGTLELLGAINTWLREMLTASAKLGTRPAPTSMEERDEVSARLMEAASVPEYNWTISETGEEIIVMADRSNFSVIFTPLHNYAGFPRNCLYCRKPLKVNMWHSSTCHAHANTRLNPDFLSINLIYQCKISIMIFFSFDLNYQLLS